MQNFFKRALKLGMKLPGLDSEVGVKFLCNFYLLESHLRATSGQDCSPAGRGGRAGRSPSLQSEIFTKPKGETGATGNQFQVFRCAGQYREIFI
jgi:hypothetical protein